MPDNDSPVSARLAILISGRGSNMLAIARACADGRLDAQVDLVIADRHETAGLAAASELGLPVDVVPRADYATRQEFDTALSARLSALNPDRIVLAGFMQILGRELVTDWSGRILNIHPSLLPEFPGLNTHQRALDAGATEHGASVHVVTAELDAGPVIAQRRVPVLRDDTAETLAQRVLAEEHQLYIEALQLSLTEHPVAINETP